jgi:hypothetical protein
VLASGWRGVGLRLLRNRGRCPFPRATLLCSEPILQGPPLPTPPRRGESNRGERERERGGERISTRSSPRSIICSSSLKQGAGDRLLRPEFRDIEVWCKALLPSFRCLCSDSYQFRSVTAKLLCKIAACPHGAAKLRLRLTARDAAAQGRFNRFGS